MHPSGGWILIINVHIILPFFVQFWYVNFRYRIQVYMCWKKFLIKGLQGILDAKAFYLAQWFINLFHIVILAFTKKLYLCTFWYCGLAFLKCRFVLFCELQGDGLGCVQARQQYRAVVQSQGHQSANIRDTTKRCLSSRVLSGSATGLCGCSTYQQFQHDLDLFIFAVYVYCYLNING